MASAKEQNRLADEVVAPSCPNAFVTELSPKQKPHLLCNQQCDPAGRTPRGRAGGSLCGIGLRECAPAGRKQNYVPGIARTAQNRYTERSAFSARQLRQRPGQAFRRRAELRVLYRRPVTAHVDRIHHRQSASDPKYKAEEGTHRRRPEGRHPPSLAAEPHGLLAASRVAYLLPRVRTIGKLNQ